jgi:TPR repeat protein
MKKILLLPVLSILLFCAPAFADFAKGSDAAQRGDYATAMKEWKPLAEQGHASAQYNLGIRYVNGQGVIQDYKAAVKWYRLAAEQGVTSAQSNLGLMYDNGEGVIQDYTRAHMWWNIAASQGHEEAMENRDKVAKEMTSLQIAEAQKLARECVAKNYKGC